MVDKKVAKKFFKTIKKHNNFLIFSHINPDGDAVGSTLALYNFLKEKNKTVDVCLKKVSKDFSFLKGFDNIHFTEDTLQKEYDIIIALDTADQSRVDINLDEYTYNSIIVIDHHVTHESFSKNTILDVDACATCQMVYDLLRGNRQNISIDVAKCIYTGILTDSGSFKNANVTPYTFEVAKNLLKLGVNANEIAQNVMNKMSLNKFELVKKALNEIQIIDNKIAYLYLDKQTMDTLANGEDGIHEGIVNYGRDIENVEVSVFIRQVDENEYKVSMRSNRYMDVSQIAQNYGGGGHIRAAGINYVGNFEEFKNNVLKDIKNALKE